MHFVEIYHIPTRDAVCGGFPSCTSNSENTANHWLTVSHVEPRNARIPGLGATRNHPIFGGLRNLISFEIFRILKTHLSSFYPYGLWTLIWCIGVFRIVCVFLLRKTAVQHNQPPVVLSAMTSSQLWRAWYLMCGWFAVIVTMFGRGRTRLMPEVDCRSWSKGNIVNMQTFGYSFYGVSLYSLRIATWLLCIAG